MEHLTPASPLHALIVDDEPLVCEMLKTFLNVSGYTAQTASNGREGLAQFQDGKFDLVILDLAIPYVSGRDLAAVMKRLAPRTPIILLTGYVGATAEDGLPLAVDAVVAKPVTLARFREVLAEVSHTETAEVS